MSRPILKRPAPAPTSDDAGSGSKKPRAALRPGFGARSRKPGDSKATDSDNKHSGMSTRARDHANKQVPVYVPPASKSTELSTEFSTELSTEPATENKPRPLQSRRTPRPTRSAMPPRKIPLISDSSKHAVQAADAAEGVTAIRLSKRMSELGLASRREADDWIERGWVRLDGEIAILGSKWLPGQKITVDERASKQQARWHTVLLHKPIGYVSGQAEDGHQPASVLVLPENQWKPPAGKAMHLGSAMALTLRKELLGLAPAGRLDIDSTGLLVLTQDGRIAKQLIGEDSDVEKEYLVRVRYTRGDRLPESDLRLLQWGLSLDGKALKPARVTWQNEDQLRFILKEGRKRQIRRMCELVGLEVLGLKRVRIGQVRLGELPLGQWRLLASDETFA